MDRLVFLIAMDVGVKFRTFGIDERKEARRNHLSNALAIFHEP